MRPDGRPDDLPKFYEAIVRGATDYIQGTRLVYPMETDAMRFLNKVGNAFFARVFSYLLGQPIKDTLCGTKVLWRKDYERIANNRHFFRELDPFGDFDLIFGAAKLNLKIMELPVRYRSRTYGETNIRRFHDGLLLLRMSLVAASQAQIRLSSVSRRGAAPNTTAAVSRCQIDHRSDHNGHSN